MFVIQGHYEEANAMLLEAQGKFTEIGDVLRATRCSHQLGNILCVQDHCKETHRVLMEVRQVFIEIGYAFGVVECSQSLGDVLHLQGYHEEARPRHWRRQERDSSRPVLPSVPPNAHKT